MNGQTKAVLAVIGVGIIGVILILFFTRQPVAPAPDEQPPETIGNVRQTTPRSRIVFEPAQMQVNRDYDQRGKVVLRNDGDTPVTLRVACDSPTDLNCGFIGRGSENWYEPIALTVGSGETWTFDFVIHANHARKLSEQIPVKAMVQDNAGDWQVAAKGLVDVTIKPLPLKLKLNWIVPDDPAMQARLVRTLRITNTGEDIPDLTVCLTDQLDEKGNPIMDQGGLAGKVYFSPTVERMALSAGQYVDVAIHPRLYPNFIQLGGMIYLHGNGQFMKVPYWVGVPEGQRVFVTLWRSTSVACNTGRRCTSQHQTNYTMPPTAGTPVPRGPGEDEEKGAFVWGTPSGDSKSAQADDDDQPAHDNVADEGLVDNCQSLVMDLDEDAIIPLSATGSDLIPSDELSSIEATSLNLNFGKDKKWLKQMVKLPEDITNLMRDPQAASRQTVIQAGKDGGVLVARHNKTENTTTLEFRNFGWGIQQDRKLKAGVPLVRNRYPVRQPTLGRTPSGKIVAAYSRPKGDRQVVTVQDVQTGEQINVGTDDPAPATSPQIVRDPRTGQSFVQYVQDGKVKQVQLNDNMTVGKPQTIFSPDHKVQRIVNSQPIANGKSVTLAKTVDDKLLMKLPDQDMPVSFDAIDGSLLTQDDGKVLVALRTRDNAIVVKTPEGQTQQIAPPDPANGPPTLVRTAAGHPRVMYHRNLGRKTDAPADKQGGTFQSDMIRGQWFTPRRTLQPEEPVTAAAVVVEFKPAYGMKHYPRMNTDVYLNNKLIGKLNQRVPDGRYLFQVPPEYLNYMPVSAQFGKPNAVRMQIQGIGKGNFHVSDKVEVFTAQNLVQEYLAGKSQQAVQALAQQSTPDIRHHKSDVMVTNNRWELPHGVMPGDELHAIIGLFNTGDVPSPPGRLIAKAADCVIGTADYGVLKPFHKLEINLLIQLPGDWPANEPLKVTVSTDVDQDANPQDNQITFTAFTDG